ncbi:MAG: hypothetical protein E6Q76_03755 [Rhizobium sp.]|nr:MAG: hypothetical protein E6Q76_03755 [Rhizobium sp.]
MASWTPNIFIGNTNTYQVTDFRDAVTEQLEDGAEMYMSLCENPPPNSQKITNASNESPIVITSAGHGLTTGEVVTIIDVGGNGAAKGTFTVTRLTNDTFSLQGSAGDGSYTKGGQWYRCLPSATALPMVSMGDGLYTVDVDGSLGLLPNTSYALVIYCLGAYRDVFNYVVRVVARVRGSN